MWPLLHGRADSGLLRLVVAQGPAAVVPGDQVTCSVHHVDALEQQEHAGNDILQIRYGCDVKLLKLYGFDAALLCSLSNA